MSAVASELSKELGERLQSFKKGGASGDVDHGKARIALTQIQASKPVKRELMGILANPEDATNPEDNKLIHEFIKYLLRLCQKTERAKLSVPSKLDPLLMDLRSSLHPMWEGKEDDDELQQWEDSPGASPLKKKGTLTKSVSVAAENFALKSKVSALELEVKQAKEMLEIHKLIRASLGLKGTTEAAIRDELKAMAEAQELSKSLLAEITGAGLSLRVDTAVHLKADLAKLKAQAAQGAEYAKLIDVIKAAGFGAAFIRTGNTAEVGADLAALKGILVKAGLKVDDKKGLEEGLRLLALDATKGKEFAAVLGKYGLRNDTGTNADADLAKLKAQAAQGAEYAKLVDAIKAAGFGALLIRTGNTAEIGADLAALKGILVKAGLKVDDKKGLEEGLKLLAADAKKAKEVETTLKGITGVLDTHLLRHDTPAHLHEDITKLKQAKVHALELEQALGAHGMRFDTRAHAEEDIGKLKTQLTAAQQQVALISGQVATLTAQRNTHEAHARELEQALGAHGMRFDSRAHAQEDIGKLAAQLSAAHSALSSSGSGASAFLATVTAERDKAQQALKEMTGALSARGFTVDSLANIQIGLDALINARADAEKQRDEAQRLLAETKIALANMANSKDTETANLKHLNGLYDKINATCQYYMKHCDALTAQIAQLQAQLKAAQEQLLATTKPTLVSPSPMMTPQRQLHAQSTPSSPSLADLGLQAVDGQTVNLSGEDLSVIARERLIKGTL